MTNRKGPRWETDLLGWIREHLDRRAYRPRQEGLEDVGDLHALGGLVVIQAKDWKDWQSAIREGLDGAVRQAAAWDATTRPHDVGAVPWEPPFPVAVVKRARKPVGEAYAVLRLEDLARLLRYLS